MICPFCLHKKTEIYNSRSTNGGTNVWRRRRCTACGKVCTTQEYRNLDAVWKVASGKKVTSYSRAKLTMSLLRACDHRKNQDDAVWYLFQIVEQKLTAYAAKNNPIPVTQLIEVAAETLKRFDPAAYVKYLSYHQPALDAKSLRKQLRR